jgi:uncharacterized caspase-like protein
MLSAKGYTVISRWVDGSNNVWYNGVNKGPLTYYTNASETTFVTGSGNAFMPSKANLSVDLGTLKSQVGSNDEFVFYFSGHGTQDTSSSPSVEYFDPSASLSWYSGDPNNPAGYYANVALCVADTEMGALLSSNIKTNRKIVILDSCNSGGFIGNTLEADATPSTTTTPSTAGLNAGTIAQAIANYASFTSTSPTAVSPYNAQVLSAAGKDESSYDGTAAMAHGAMTYYFLQTAASGDLNGDGSVTVLEAFSLVKAAIEKNWNTSYPSYAFTPHISGGPVDFVLF